MLAAAGVSTGSSAALEELCETYWYPAYAYVRRLGYTADDAADLTQAFFARVLEKQFFKDARPERGRFRSFLLASLRHFTLNELDWKNARRRGGGITHVPIDFAVGEDRYRREPADDLTPERIYERRWALAVLARARARLSAKCARTGRQQILSILLPHLVGDEPASYATLAASRGSTESAVRQTLHRLKREFRTILRETIAETVERPEDVDDELRYLLRAISQQG